MQHITHLKLEQEISKLAYAFISRDARIGGAIIDNLCDRFSLEEVAGITLICLQRIMWFDADAFVWTIENLIPAEVMREIRQISSVTLGKRLIDKGLMPGQDFSVDSISAGRFLAALRRKMQG